MKEGTTQLPWFKGSQTVHPKNPPQILWLADFPGCQASWRAASKCDDATGFAGHTINSYGSANVKGGPLEGEG